MDGYPIYESLSAWSYKYHFFQNISEKESDHRTLRFIFEIILYIQLTFKILAVPVIFYKVSISSFSNIFFMFTWQFISLEFLGIKLITFALFVFTVVFSIILVIYYNYRPYMYIHMLNGPFCFILKSLFPLIQCVSASCLGWSLYKIITNDPHLFVLSSSTFTFLVSSIYSYIGFLFSGPLIDYRSVRYCSWDHMTLFWIILAANLVQISWILDAVYKFGVYIVFGCSALLCLLIFFWLSKLPFMTEKINKIVILWNGLIVSMLVIAVFVVAHLIDIRIGFVLFLIAIFLWSIILAKGAFNLFCKLVLKRSKFNPDYIFDTENNLLLPECSPRILISLIRYLMITGYHDITAILIAAVDSERSSKLTIECVRMLMILNNIPYRIRMKLFDIEVIDLSVSLKQSLYTILFEVNRIRTNFEDMQEAMQILENKKQRAKISLYAFVNSLIESNSNFAKEVNCINFAVASLEYKAMAKYNLERNYLYTDLINSYVDYLLKIDGDYINSGKIMNSVGSIKHSLVRVNESHQILNFNEVEKPSNSNVNNFSEMISNQKALEIVPNWSLRLIIFTSLVLLVSNFFPLLTIKSHERERGFNNDQYFQHSHSPPFFICAYTIWNINIYLILMNNSLDANIMKQFEIPGLNNLREYLSKVQCMNDGKSVMGGIYDDPDIFSDEMYELYAYRYAQYYVSPNEIAFKNTHQSLEICHDLFIPLIQRYVDCALSLEKDTSFKLIGTCCGVSFLFLVINVIVIFGSLGGVVNKMVKIYNGIEATTLEEFRSNLFVTIHSKKSSETIPDNIDNDGALELEEIEAAEVAGVHDHDYTEMIEQIMQGEINFKPFSPMHRNYFVLYLFMTFALRYIIGFVVVELFDRMFISYVHSNALEHSIINFTSNLFLEIDAYLANASGTESAIPNKIPVTGAYGGQVQKITRDWNSFLDKYPYNNGTQSQTFIKNIIHDISRVVDQQYSTNVHQMHAENTIENLHYFITLFCEFWMIYFLYVFIGTGKYIMRNVAHIVLVLRSKYSSTFSILINALTFAWKSEQDFNFQPISEMIVNQSTDPVIFFDSKMVVTGANQQAIAQFGHSDMLEDNTKIDEIIPRNKNEIFYQFIKNMKTPYGIIAKRSFEFCVKTNEGGEVPFSGTMIPLKDNKFGLMMKNQSEVVEMKNEMQTLRKQILMLLKRLLHQEIANKMIADDMPQQITIPEAVVFAATLKRHSENMSDQDLYNYEITEVCISIIDRLLGKYKTITRMRTLNGDFVFITGLFDEESAEERLKVTLEFAREAAIAIKNFLECSFLLTGSINIGGPIHCSFTGISRTMFDFFSATIVSTYDILDLVPAGKLLLYEEAYNCVENKDMYMLYRPSRELPKNVYILQTYLDM